MCKNEKVSRLLSLNNKHFRLGLIRVVLIVHTIAPPDGSSDMHYSLSPSSPLSYGIDLKVISFGVYRASRHVCDQTNAYKTWVNGFAVFMSQYEEDNHK